MSSQPGARATLNKLCEFKDLDLDKDVKARSEALGQCRQLISQLESPQNTATELLFSPFVAIAVRIAVNMNVFEVIHTSHGPIKVSSLAEICQAEELLLSRVLRMLASIGFVAQPSEDTWSSTPYTQAMAQPALGAGYRFVWDIMVTSAIRSPQFLLETNHLCPTQPTDGFVQYALQTKRNTFEYLALERPDRLRDFGQFMGHTMGDREYWTDWYPAEERLMSGWDQKSVLLVDVGGGRGHDVEAFAQKYPNSKGHLVLQDLPHVIEVAFEGKPMMETQHQDFFQVNKVKGARAYFFHHILHDWSDEYCLKILSGVREAMNPGYSKILIHDLVLPDKGASTYQCIWDFAMMTFNSGSERSRAQWTSLVERAGLEVERFWEAPSGGDADALIEIVCRSKRSLLCYT